MWPLRGRRRREGAAGRRGGRRGAGTGEGTGVCRGAAGRRAVPRAGAPGRAPGRGVRSVLFDSAGAAGRGRFLCRSGEPPGVAWRYSLSGSPSGGQFAPMVWKRVPRVLSGAAGRPGWSGGVCFLVHPPGPIRSDGLEKSVEGALPGRRAARGGLAVFVFWSALRGPIRSDGLEKSAEGAFRGGGPPRVAWRYSFSGFPSGGRFFPFVRKESEERHVKGKGFSQSRPSL